MRCCAAVLRSAPTTRHFSHWTVPPTRTRNLPEAEYNDLESIEIPGDTTLWKTQNIPPKKIHLPIEAYGNFRWYFPVFGVVAALALYYSAGFYRIAAQNWAVGSLIEKMTWSTEVLGCLIICVFSTGILTRDIFDSVTSRPLLIITKEALWDRRQLHAPVPWCDIESIRFQSFRDTLLVHLKLAQPVPVRSGVFRLGGALRGGLRSKIQVLISHLDQNDETIAKVLVALVRKNGGKIE